MDKVRNDIKIKQFEKVYLLFGQENYLINMYKNMLKKAVVGDDEMNTSFFEGKGIQINAVRESIMTMPFLAGKRLVMLEDTGLCKTSAEEWLGVIKEIPETCVVIFVEHETDKRSKLYKLIRDEGYCCEINRQTPQEISQWVLKGFKQYGLQITREALESFLEKTGNDMDNIRSEMEKLAGYCTGENGITIQDVEEVCTVQTENRVFEMIRETVEGNSAKALELYYDMLALKEPSMRIMFLIAKQMNQLLCIKEMQTSRVPQAQIAQNMKISPYIAGKLIRQAAAFNNEQLRSCVEQCVSLEQAVKVGNMNEKIAVEMVLLSISRKVIMK